VFLVPCPYYLGWDWMSRQSGSILSGVKFRIYTTVFRSALKVIPAQWKMAVFLGVMRVGAFI